MALKKIWARTSSWFTNRKDSDFSVDSMADDSAKAEGHKGTSTIADAQSNTKSNKTAVKTVPLRPEVDSVVKQQESFNKLVDKLHDINQSLHHQLVFNEELISKMDKLPELLGNIPVMMENQQKFAEQLFEQLAANSVNNQQLQETIEKIPAQTEKQTVVFAAMSQQLSASAESDAKLANNFHKFNDTLVELNHSNQCHKDSILQMSNTFASSDRYLKYLMARQNKQFIWVFVIAMAICSASIVALIAMFIYFRP